MCSSDLFIAGRDVARAAQNVPGNNGQGQGGAGALLEELAAAEGRDGFCISGLRRFHFRTTARISLAGVLRKMRGKKAAVSDFSPPFACAEDTGGRIFASKVEKNLRILVAWRPR